MSAEKECCPRFDPGPWQERWVTLDGKRFVKDRVRSFLRVPLNFGAVMAAISATCLAQAYEGAYRNIPHWIADLKRRVADKGKGLKKLYFYYTTCPVCAKKYGKNYVVLFAQV